MTDPSAALAAAAERARLKEQAAEARREIATAWAKYYRSNTRYLHSRALALEAKAVEAEELAAVLGGEPYPVGVESLCDVASEGAEE